MVRRDMSVFSECHDIRRVNKDGVRDEDTNFCIENDAVQKKLLDEAIVQLDPNLLNDINIFPIKMSVIARMLEMSPGWSGVLVPSNTSFRCRQIDRDIELIGPTGVVAITTPGRMLGYCARQMPAAYATVAQFLRVEYCYNADRTVTEGERREILGRLLHDYRMDRMFSRTLEAISKMEQLPSLDYDHVILKFKYLDSVDIKNKTVYHFGAGDSVSGSAVGLYEHYDNVVCIDPRLTHGGKHVAARFDDVDIPDDVDIISDMAYGDQYGMSDADHSYYEKLFARCMGQLVIVKISVATNANIRGFVLRKPRPHNMEIILQMHTDGYTMDELFNKYENKIVRANVERNKKMVNRGTFTRNLMPRYDDAEYSKIITTEPYLPKIIGNVGLCGAPGTAKMIFDMYGGKNNYRHKIFYTHLKKLLLGARRANTYAYVPVNVGNAIDSDPNFPDVIFSANSVYKSALRYYSVQRCGDIVAIREK